MVPISQESKKGFGESSKSHNNKGARQGQPKKQQRGLGNAADTKKAVLLRDGSQELQSVIKSVEKDYAKKNTQRLNIDKDVAARGNVDFVKVESWGDQGKDQSELDDLKVKSFSPAFSSSDSNAPFYERLVHRLQLLESKGDISVVQAQSLPQFQDWAFGENRYLQYLVDLHAVFDTLRLGVSSIQNSAFSDADSSKEEANIEKAAMAVGIFNDALGLDRSEALQGDIKALSRAMSAANDKVVELPEPTTQTTAYVKYLKQLVRVACDEKQSCLRILAHIFAVYVTHLTTGMRIGAKALDCIPVLKQAKGVSFYRDYPQHVTDPLKVFIAAINNITDFVSIQEDQELVMEELPRAIQKTSLLLVVLAVKEQHENNDLSANVPVVQLL